MELYLYEDYRECYPELSGGQLTERLICDAAEEYGIREPRVLRDERGKPYLDGESVFLSVSHSGRYFVCVLDSVPVGIDIQQERKLKKEIAHRYFTDRENRWIREHGESGFFKLWTRKEAYCKYLGTGLAEIIKGTDVLNRQDVEFMEFQLEKGMYCACCRKKTK